MTKAFGRYVVPVWFALIVFGITAPWWFTPGYVWLLDSVWGPHEVINWAHPDTGLVWQILVHVLSVILSASITEKLILTLILWAIGMSGYFLARKLVGPWFAWAAGTLYLLNPFVYERLLGGQWIVLAGYAYMPVVLAVAYDTLQNRGKQGAYRLAALLAIFPLVSPHFAYITVWLLLLLAGVYIVLERPTWLWTKRTASWCAALAAIGLIGNWFWLSSPAGRAFQHFNAIDFAAFRTATDPVVGLWGNVLGLYGFWRGQAVIQPKFYLGNAWIVVAAAIVILAIVGAVRAFRSRSTLGITLVIAAPIALVLAVGYSSTAVRPLTLFLMNYLPGFRGLRDTEKLVGVLALAYAILASYGAAWLCELLPRLRPMNYASPAFLAILAAISVTGIWDGASRQIAVADYPTGWYTVRADLARHPASTVVVFPWHNYLSLNFAENNYVAQPAGVFFSNPIIASDEVDSVLTARPDNAADHLMLALTSGQVTPGIWAKQLRALGASYVVVENTDDGIIYQSLVRQAGLPLLYQDQTISLYQLPAK